MSTEFEVLIFLLIIVTFLVALAVKIRIPYPILLVLAGGFIGYVPSLPNYTLEPDVVFLLFLPPILYSAAWYTSWRDFKKEIRSITYLAIGLTLFTTIVVGYFAHLLFNLSLPIGFLIGAIISPPDAVAATTITHGLNLPKRIITILEGESLINDAIGLVAYKFAVAAVVTGGFSLSKAGSSFIIVSFGGIFIGFVFGYLAVVIHTWLRDNPAIETVLTILTPYSAFLTAEKFHVSGVLAVVTAGLYVTWRAPELFSSLTRLQAVASWDIIIFLLNGFIFLLIGLQLPVIIQNISQRDITQLYLYGAVISIITILVRFAWTFPNAYINYYFTKKIHPSTKKPPIKNLIVISWTGLRGVVSLAAAMALPLNLENGKPFPERDLILFVTCFVIFSTLVLQGLALPLLIKFLKLEADTSVEEEELHARLMAAKAALEYIDDLYMNTEVSRDLLDWLKVKYKTRIREIKAHYHEEEEEEYRKSNPFEPSLMLKIQRGILASERAMIIQLRMEGVINDEALRKIERELDLEEAKIKK
jgi:CPA1 family monovalent cation:H+ antiporter